MQFRKIIKIVMCVLILIFTFHLGSNHGWLKCEENTKKAGVYVYNTQEKLDAYYSDTEKTILALELPRELTSDAINRERRMRPLVVAGPIVVFFDDNNGSYQVYEENVHKSLVSYDRSAERFDLQYFNNKIENGWRFSRFSSAFTYSKEGIYEKGLILIFDIDGMLMRVYRDTMGTGVLDEMQVYEKNIMIVYHLNGMSWEKVAERQNHPTLMNYENILSIVKEASSSNKHYEP